MDHPDSLRRNLVRRHEKLGSDEARKYICRTRAIRSSRSIRLHAVRGVHSSRTITDTTRFHVNHYVTQSVEYFQKVKMTRGDADNAVNDNTRTMEYFRSYDMPCVVQDRLLADMVAAEARTDQP